MTTTPPAAPHPIRVGLADDDALVRRLLTQVIDRDPGLCVAWAVGNGTEVLNRLSHASDDNAPQAPDVDVLLLDINMPGTNGVDAAKALHEVYPDLPVIMLTTLDRTEYVTDVMGAGAVGFLRKDDREDRLLTAIRATHQGIAVFSMETARRLVKEPMGRTPLSDESSPLTQRETEVLRMVAQSLTNGQIGRRLGVSEATVKSQISSIIAKLSCTDRVGMVKWGFHNGVLG